MNSTQLKLNSNSTQRTQRTQRTQKNMTYNPKQERTRRQERMDKRRPEKKSPRSPKNPTKPKNHAKIAELKARRGQHINDAIDCSDLEHENEFHRLEMVALWHHLYGLIKPRCWPYIVECEHDDGTFSIYTDGWPY